jgi:hypothetical protein
MVTSQIIFLHEYLGIQGGEAAEALALRLWPALVGQKQYVFRPFFLENSMFLLFFQIVSF